jgi:hypothetical protein
VLCATAAPGAGVSIDSVRSRADDGASAVPGGSAADVNPALAGSLLWTSRSAGGLPANLLRDKATTFANRSEHLQVVLAVEKCRAKNPIRLFYSTDGLTNA